MVRANGAEVFDTDQIEMTIAVFQSFGDKLIDTLCHDCIGGHDVSKMLSLSCIDMLLDLDSMAGFVQFISRSGYLKNIVDNLAKSDVRLCRILDSTPTDMKALYIYESQMATLCRVGSSYVGAEQLLEQQALNVLARMKVFDLHPDFQVVNYAQENSFIPPIDVRYQQILFPALNLCHVVLNTLGVENHSAITQILHFLLSHGDMIEILLRAGTPMLNVGLLQELSSVSGIVARTVNQELAGMVDVTLTQDLGAHLYRLQKLMMTLFPRFIISEKMLRDMTRPDSMKTPPSDAQKSLQLKYFLEIAANLALYARNSVSNHAVDHRSIKVLFSPVISEEIHRQDQRTGNLDASPSLGVVVTQLRNCVEHYNREKFVYDNLQRQRNALPNLSLDASVQTQNDDLSAKLRAKQDELRLCVFITEHCLYLLWSHLDFYMLKAVSTDALSGGGSGDSFISAPLETSWRVTADDISALKKNLVSVLTETFCKQLLNTTQEQTRNDRGFVEAMLRRIKRLIQFVPVK